VLRTGRRFAIARRSALWHLYGKADVAKSVDATDFQLECPRGNSWSRTAQSRGTLTGSSPRPIPSQALD
jgi:hypothetical protein